ncbi:hypothetical protein GQ457_03G024200 [Hibiscus cannabinus]
MTTSLYLLLHQMLDRLAEKHFYCFLDGYSGYNQIAIALKKQSKKNNIPLPIWNFCLPSDAIRAVQRTCHGTFAFRRMLFGLCNAPATFQRCMTAIFSDLNEDCLEIFMDVFSTFGDNFDNCLRNLEKFLKRCKETNLVLNWEKCHFMVDEGIVLGHKISSKGMEVDKAKIEVISKLPPPTTVKGIRSFLGHAGFYRRFIEDFSKITKPLCSLLEQGIPFEFNNDYTKAFNLLKQKLLTAPIVEPPDWKLPFELMCDASDYAVGAVLGQRKGKIFHPIYYASKTLNDAQVNYTTTEKEMLAVIFAFDKFRSYLIGTKPLKSFISLSSYPFPLPLPLQPYSAPSPPQRPSSIVEAIKSFISFSFLSFSGYYSTIRATNTPKSGLSSHGPRESIRRRPPSDGFGAEFPKLIPYFSQKKKIVASEKMKSLPFSIGTYIPKIPNPVIRCSKTNPKLGSIGIVQQQTENSNKLLPQPGPSVAATEACELTVSPLGLAFCDKVVGKGPEAVKRQLIKGNWRMGKCLIATITVGSLLHSVSASARCLPGYPYKCPKLQIIPEKGLTKCQADTLLSLLNDQANANAREGRVMIFNLVEAAQEFLSEIVPVGQSQESVSLAGAASSSPSPSFLFQIRAKIYLYYNIMGRGKFKGKPTGHRHFSTPEELRAGTSARPRSFKKEEAEVAEEEEESEEEVEEEPEKRKGTQGLIEIENPNLAKQKNVKAKDVDMGRTTELSRREREEIEKQKAHERYMKLQEQGKTEQARKDLERLAMIRQQRAEAAKKREEEKAAREQKKTEARK